MIKLKSDTLKSFKDYRNKVGNELGRQIKGFRSERKGECLSIEFYDHFRNYGMVSITGFSKDAIM